MLKKPVELFGRDAEWESLARFMASDKPGLRMGVVYGRRRQGKTMLLQGLLQAAGGGFYWQARQQSSAQNLASFARALSNHAGRRIDFTTWESALDGLAHELRAETSSGLAILDEVGYLLDSDPAVPSHLQSVLAPLSAARKGPRTRLLLCGSAFSQMKGLVDPDAPLRGRADLELVVGPFGPRDSADFWGLKANPDAAFRLHALVGGTPAHKDYALDSPSDGDIDAWAQRNLLSRSSPLFREGRVAVAEDPALADQTLYWATISAIADGARKRSEVTAALGRPPTSLAHVLTTLVEAGWIAAESDPMRQRSTRFVLDEPMVRFHRLVVEPNEASLALRPRAQQAWEESLPIVRSQIYGPHLERLARQWLLGTASTETLGGRAHDVGPATVGSGRKQFSLDALAVEKTSRGATRVLAIAEVKATATPVGLSELERLDAAAEFAPHTKRILVGRSGFTAELTRLARRRGDVELVDLYRLYDGD
jgi:uncharacterized protein